MAQGTRQLGTKQGSTPGPVSVAVPGCLLASVHDRRYPALQSALELLGNEALYRWPFARRVMAGAPHDIMDTDGGPEPSPSVIGVEDEADYVERFDTYTRDCRLCSLGEESIFHLAYI